MLPEVSYRPPGLRAGRRPCFDLGFLLNLAERAFRPAEQAFRLLRN